jgi:cytochrome c oxidase cbb3-type subunit III
MSNPKEEGQPLAGHEYDGIVELDNPLPLWWLYAFYMTIVFSVLYVAYYHVGPGQSLVGAYFEKVAVIEDARAASSGLGFDDESIVALQADASRMQTGAGQYAEKCAACHGDAGQGTIGPNLADAYWIHGGSPSEIAATIQKGVGDMGMPAWADMMTHDDIQAVAAFILSLQGTNPEGAREPQGELFEVSQ